MKKIAIALIVITLITPFGFADTDYSIMSDDALLELRNEIDREINARGIEFETLFYPGVYVVGKDIIEGDYDMLFDEIDEWGIYVDVYEDEEAMKNGDEILSELVEKPSKGQHVQLKDGMILKIDPIGGVQMRIKKSKPIWKP